MTDLVDARHALPRPRDGGAAPTDRHPPQPADPPSGHAAGIELRRLLARAQLTVAQGVELAAAVSAEAVRRSPPAPGAAGREPVLHGPVVIGADGRVVAGRPAGTPGAGCPPDGRPAGETVGSVLADVATAIRPRARCGGPAAEELVAGLDRAVGELPVAGLPAVAQALRELAAGIDRRTVRAELGALVAVIGGLPEAAGGRPPAGASTTTTSPLTSRSPSTAGRSGSAKRRIGAWLLSLLVLAGIAIGEVGALRDHIAADVGTLLDAGRSGSGPSTAPAPSARPLPAPAPATAGAVQAVDLRALAPCAAGSACPVRLEVRLAPGTADRVVRWSYRVVDRCTGATLPAPGGAVAVPAGAGRVEAVGVVALPAALPAVAVFARTDAPAAAASPPLLVGSCPPATATG